MTTGDGTGNNVAAMPTDDIDVEYIESLYGKYADELRAARDAQRRLRRSWSRHSKSQLDDVEAEITYLLLRDRRPRTVVEIGSLHGWSTTWMLRALFDNQYGELYSYDLRGVATENVPAELGDGRWTFTQGDARKNLAAFPVLIDHLFIDAAHNARFARWYTRRLLPSLPAGATVSVHDVFHHRRPLPFSEGAVLLGWLAREKTGYFTAARAHAPETAERLSAVRDALALGGPIHDGTDDPMVCFTVHRTGRSRRGLSS